MRPVTIKDFKAGSIAGQLKISRTYSIPPGKRAEDLVTPVTVKTVGKKYVTVDSKARFEPHPSGAAGHLLEHSEYSPEYMLFTDVASAAEYVRKSLRVDLLRSAVKSTEPDDYEPSADQLGLALALLERPACLAGTGMLRPVITALAGTYAKGVRQREATRVPVHESVDPAGYVNTRDYAAVSLSGMDQRAVRSTVTMLRAIGFFTVDNLDELIICWDPRVTADTKRGDAR